MKPLKLPAICLPEYPIRYPQQWNPGDIEVYWLGIPNEICEPLRRHLERFGWRENPEPVYSSDITVVNGSAYVHKDNDFGVLGIALIDSGNDETELITRHGGVRMCVGDVVVFDSDEWHAWISHGPCALASICVAPIITPISEVSQC